jgi:hypothetical protein
MIAPPPDTIPTLQELCMTFIAKHPKFRTLEGILELFSNRIDLDLYTFLPLKELVNKNLNEYYPYLLDKVGQEVLQENFPNIPWDEVHARYLATKKQKDYFRGIKGTIIERQAVVEYISDYYPYDALKSGVQWPGNVDPSHREQFLSDDDFRALFNMSKEEFRQLPLFIRKRMKTEKSLF